MGQPPLSQEHTSHTSGFYITHSAYPVFDLLLAAFASLGRASRPNSSSSQSRSAFWKCIRRVPLAQPVRADAEHGHPADHTAATAGMSVSKAIVTTFSHRAERSPIGFTPGPPRRRRPAQRMRSGSRPPGSRTRNRGPSRIASQGRAASTMPNRAARQSPRRQAVAGQRRLPMQRERPEGLSTGSRPWLSHSPPSRLPRLRPPPRRLRLPRPGEHPRLLQQPEQ